MSSLLDAANVSSNKFTIGKLPVKSGDVSFMTMKQLYDAAENTAYCVYGIAGYAGRNSTLDNLQSIDLDWYRQKNKPATCDQIFSINGQAVFGGPFRDIDCFNDIIYHFNWSYANNSKGDSGYDSYWGKEVDESVYVAVVHK